MGARWMNTMTVKAICWVLALIVIVTNFYLTITFVAGDAQPVWFYVLFVVLGLLYISFIGVLVRQDVLEFVDFVRTGKSSTPGGS